MTDLIKCKQGRIFKTMENGHVYEIKAEIPVLRHGPAVTVLIHTEHNWRKATNCRCKEQECELNSMDSFFKFIDGEWIHFEPMDVGVRK